MEQASESGRPARAGKSEVTLAKAKEKAAPLVGDLDGVAVTLDKSRYSVHAPYNPRIASLLRAVTGASFNREAGAWNVPLEQYDALSAALPAARAENVEDSRARLGIAERAKGVLQAMTDAPIAIGEFHPRDVTLYGTIVSVNGRYAAQHTGSDDRGQARVVIHRLDDLQEPVFNGERVGITYGGRGRANVEPVVNANQSFADSLGQTHEGVKVVATNDSYVVSFDYSPALSERIQRIDGAAYDRESKSWVVPSDKKEFLARAVRDMRAEYAADKADRHDAEQLASQKVDGANVRAAYTADGQAYAGRVVGVAGRYVVQHTGREFMALHRASALDVKPSVGADVKIVYDRGRGRVTERTKDKAQEQSR